MQKFILTLCLASFSFLGIAQTSIFSALFGTSWSSAASWSGGVPNAATNATINGLVATITVDVAANCANLSFGALNSMTINKDITLTVNGDLNTVLGGTIKNNGTLILKGNVSSPTGDKVVTVEGGLVSTGGLTFPTFEIE